jgi:hypothetical protein
MVLTMIDGKICNAVTSTFAPVCYVCGAAPKQMNHIHEIVKRDVDVTTYEFGLCTLHAWIRFLECLLHFSYHLEIKEMASKRRRPMKGTNKKKGYSIPLQK